METLKNKDNTMTQRDINILMDKLYLLDNYAECKNDHELVGKISEFIHYINGRGYLETAS